MYEICTENASFDICGSLPIISVHAGKKLSV